jgi:hypothetical protein
MSKMQDEYDLHVQVVAYLKLKYPDTMFRSDLAGIRLTIGLARKAKRLQNGRGWPDLLLAEPRRGYAGLFIELKASHADLYTKNGQLRQVEHIQEQLATLEALRERGYRAEFAVGFDGAQTLIDWYLSLPFCGLAGQ